MPRYIPHYPRIPLKAALCFFLSVIAFPVFSYGQNDSLLRIISSTKSDTTKFRLCNLYSAQLSASDNKSSIYFANEAQKIAIKRNDKRGQGEAMNNLAFGLYYSGESDSAIRIYNDVIQLSRSVGDSTNVFWALNRLGFIYREKGEYEKALISYNQALASNTGEKNKSEAANSYLNIGVVYHDQNNLKDALRYEEKGLKLYLETGETARIANCLARLGNAYLDSKDTLAAMDYYKRSLEMFTKADNPRGIAVCLNNIANLYKEKKDLPKALEYYDRALAIREKIGDKNGIALICNNVGSVYLSQKEYDKAILYYDKSLAIAISLDYVEQMKANYLGLSQSYEALGNYETSLSYYKNYYDANDSLYNETKSKKINELNIKFDTERKQKENESLTIENDLQVRRNIFMAAALGLVLILVVVVWRNARKSKRANILLEHQKSEITSQKKIVEEQHRDIVDSINYAKRIQRAVLPTQQEIHELFPQSFIFFRPRDIVSGDFWWIGQSGNIKIIAVADCTGHGVPGAFMSLIGNTALNEVVKEKHITDPGEILYHLAQNIVAVLKQEQREKDDDHSYAMKGIKDGMDISLCALDEKNGVLRFAGANTPLYYVQNGEMKVIRGDRQPVGIFEGELTPFTAHTIPLEGLEAFYIFSDGYADQFGGELGKKFKSSRLKELLFSSYTKDAEQQQKTLADVFNNWKSNLDQVDDVLVAGVKLK
ncbi:MAG: tetratricopeptide repeat protein [Bacteroidota bacterium]|nr:tetratricopeptide repeat protein [Bacteroidota bacterium]